jgi:hypothetical protein
MTVDSVRQATRYRLPLADAEYAWPKGDAAAVEWYGTGDPVLALGLLPHANEPLGSAIRRPLAGLAPGAGRIAVVGPVDPPPANRRFPLPGDLRDFLRLGHLQPLDQQAEFGHCSEPRTPAQHRAACFRRLVREVAPAALILLHNDPFARVPYLYADRRWPVVEHLLTKGLGDVFPDEPAAEPEWTSRLSPRVHAYFKAAVIGVRGSEAAGIFLPHYLGIPVLTAELPMFRWGEAEAARPEVLAAMETWIEHGAGDSRTLLAEAERLIGGLRVPMVEAQVSARVVHAVMEGVRAELGR